LYITFFYFLHRKYQRFSRFGSNGFVVLEKDSSSPAAIMCLAHVHNVDLQMACKHIIPPAYHPGRRRNPRLYGMNHRDETQSTRVRIKRTQQPKTS
jgi:hypothetical protein